LPRPSWPGHAPQGLLLELPVEADAAHDECIAVHPVSLIGFFAGTLRFHICL
jgi:hypothetical protein